MAIVKKENITSIIPQRAPIVMIDSLETCEKEGASTLFKITEDNLFVSDGVMSESGILENIAQTAAAKVGREYQLLNEPVPLGFIGAISKINIEDLPNVGDEIETVIKIKQEIFDVTLITGICKLGDKKLAECEMKIIVAQDQEKE